MRKRSAPWHAVEPLHLVTASPIDDALVVYAS